MKRTGLFLFFAALTVFAQPPVAPTTDVQVGDPRGDNAGEYNIMQSWELGYRYATVGGNFGMYRSAVNYLDGVRLLSSSLSIQSKDGHGKWFDHLQINTLGLGGDPYQSASMQIDKNRIYSYSFSWRLNDYYNPAPTISFGEQFFNTQHTMQDQDLTLFPQSNVRFFLGYSRNDQSGLGGTTIQLFDQRGDEFPLLQDVRVVTNEYRLGGEVNFFGIRLNVMKGWLDFRDDTPTNIINSPEQGNNPFDLTTLTAYQSTQPYHGTSPYWRVGLFSEGKKMWALNGRFTYVGGERDFIDNEMSAGTIGSGAAATRQIYTFGDASRPALATNLNFTVFPTSNLTITNQTTFNNIRIVGDSYFAEIDNGLATQPFIAFTFLGIRTIANSTDLKLRVNKKFMVTAGYHYSDRRISVIDGQQNAGLPAPGPPANVPITQSNVLWAGMVGFTYHPIQPLTFLFQGELGIASMPYTPISDGNYNAIRARVEYKKKSFRVSGYYKSDYNTNSTSLTSFASRGRNFGVDGTWNPNEWFFIDAGYSKLHLNTLGGIDFFANNLPVSGDSLYISNIHAGNLGTRFAIHKKADFYVGLSYIQDTGDGRSTPDGNGIDISIPAFQAVQTFPLKYISPQARFSLQLHKQVRWNIGYQYYGYSEQFSTFQNFRANTGYSSILWSF